MSYRRTHTSVGADPAPAKTSIFNLVGMDRFIKIEKTDGGLPIWVWVGGAGVVVLGLLGGFRLLRKRAK